MHVFMQRLISFIFPKHIFFNPTLQNQQTNKKNEMFSIALGKIPFASENFVKKNQNSVKFFAFFETWRKLCALFFRSPFCQI